MLNFYYYSKKLIELLNIHSDLFDLIQKIDSNRLKVIINPQEIVGARNDNGLKLSLFQQFAKRINEANNEILNIVREKRPNEIFRLINELISDLNLFDTSFNDDNRLIVDLKRFSDLHTDAYSEKQPGHIFAFSEICSKIHQTKKDMEEKANYIIINVESQKREIPGNYLKITIGTDRDVPLIIDFVSIFNSIEELYLFICRIHKIDILDSTHKCNF